MDANQRVKGKKVYVFEEIVKEIEDSGISSICRTINKFNKIMEDSNVASKNEDLENLIKEDVTLAISVLKAANSPLYRSKNEINDISNAINMIGWDTIYKIAMSLTVKGLVKTAKVRTFANWMITRAITIANIAETFLQAIKLSNDKLFDINSIYAYGLLHDIGTIGLLQSIEHYQQDVMEIKLIDDKKNWADAEQILYGFDHNMVGEQILLRAYLPRSFSVVARHHHSPDSANYPKAEAKKITLIRLSQTSIIDNHKFSEHEAFSNFNSVGEENNLIRKYDDFSNVFKQEFEEQLGLTEEIYNEIISTKLTNDSIKKISQQFLN